MSRALSRRALLGGGCNYRRLHRDERDFAWPKLGRRGVLMGVAAAMTAGAAAASPLGWLKLRLAAILRITLPASQTVRFGDRTRAGHGGHPLQYTGPDALVFGHRYLGITAGNGAGHWTIDNRNHLVPAGTYDLAPPAFIAGVAAYTLTVAEYYDSGHTSPTGVTSTVQVDIIANAAHAREMVTTPSAVNQDNYASTSNHYQLNKLMIAMGAPRIQIGDTVYLRDGAINPTPFNAPRLQLPSVAWTVGSGGAVRDLPDGTTEPAFLITSENPDTTSVNPDGHKKWGGGGMLAGIKVDAPAGNDFHYPIQFEYVSFSWLNDSLRTTGKGVDKVIGWTNTVPGYGYSIRHCYFGAGPNVSVSDYRNTYGVQTHRNCVLYENYFERLGWGFDGSQDVKITWNVFHHIVSDGMQFGNYCYQVEITDNFEYAKASGLYSGAHADGLQLNWGSSTPVGTFVFGTIARNLLEHGDALAGGNGGQGLFMNPSGAPSGSAVRMTNMVVINNIYHDDHQNMLEFVWADNPTIRFNIALRANGGLNPLLLAYFEQHPNYTACSDGDYSLNIANFYDRLFRITGSPTIWPLMGAPNSGPIGATKITGVAASDAVYRAAFPGFPTAAMALAETGKALPEAWFTTRARTIAAWTPLRGGPAMHSDGRYYGPLFPVDDHGVVSWNTGGVFDPTAVHTPLDPRYFTT
jgi:hypothetical protein